MNVVNVKLEHAHSWIYSLEITSFLLGKGIILGNIITDAVLSSRDVLGTPIMLLNSISRVLVKLRLSCVTLPPCFKKCPLEPQNIEEEEPFKTTSAGRQKRQLGEPLEPVSHAVRLLFRGDTAADTSTSWLAATGITASECFLADSGKLTQCVFGHWDVVTCLAYSRHVGLTGGDAFVVSGSRDATVLVWRWSMRFQRVAASDRAEGDNPSPLAILTGHEQPVVCVDVSASLGLVVSGSQEGPCLLHTTTGNLLRTLRGPGECVRPRLLKLTRDGLVLVNYTDGTGHLAVFTVNGRLLSDKGLDDQMLALALNKDGNFFVSGGFSR
ncbi:hypothetical protein OS493_040288, partial [Desmophyllum pertusum]